VRAAHAPPICDLDGRPPKALGRDDGVVHIRAEHMDLISPSRAKRLETILTAPIVRHDGGEAIWQPDIATFTPSDAFQALNWLVRDQHFLHFSARACRMDSAMVLFDRVNKGRQPCHAPSLK
jgi:hypothetical protein